MKIIQVLKITREFLYLITDFSKYLQNGGSETHTVHEGHLSISSILVKAHAPILDAAISLTSS
jgi:hypothetical protein